MTNEEYTFEDLIRDIGEAVARIAEILGDPITEPLSLITLLQELGWNVNTDEVIDGANLPILQVGQQIGGLVSGGGPPDLPRLLDAGRDFLQAGASFVGDIGLAGDAPMLADMEAALPKQFLDYLLIEFLREEFPLLYGILAAAGIAVVKYEEPAEAYRLPYFSQTMRWDVLKKSLAEPSRFFEFAYGWGLTDFDGEILFDGLAALLGELNIEVMRGTVSDDPALNNEAVTEPLRLSVLEHENVEFGFELYVAELLTGGHGLAISPYAVGGFDFTVPLGEFVNFRMKAAAVLDRDLGFRLSPDAGLEVFSNIGLESLNGSADAAIEVVPDAILAGMGNPEGTLLELGALAAGVNVTVVNGAPEIGLRLILTGLHIHATAAGADGFIAEILGDTELDARVDVTVGWSSKDGMYLEASGAIEVTIPLHKQLGPILFDTLWLSLAIDTGAVQLSAGLTLGAEIGPVSVAVDRMGVTAHLTFGGAGDFGIEDTTYGFLPPLGAGISVDSGITGGGYVEFDDANKRYAGVLGLNFGEIGLTAIALITTRMPDGSDGFSMLINIGVTFDPAIQLSYNFTLMGVGGLIGIHRDMVIEVLQAGIKTKTLDSILFPDPATVVQNAPKIISDLRAVFPPEEGRFVVGPMVKIGWGSPAIVEADIGIFISLPEPIDIVLMGQVLVTYPEPEDPVVLVNMDILGVLQIEKKLLTFQTSIYDSRILTYTLYGDTAFLLFWGDDPEFALSLGGFHPKFDPPPPPLIFSGLKRLGLGMSSGSNFSLTCEAYQALTPNSLQFGARLDLYAKESGAVVKGHLGFDALFYFSPFSFEVWIGGAVNIRVSGQQLADIRLDFTLSGPTPWNARGKAVIKVLFFDIEAGFNFTWGSAEKKTLPSQDPWSEVIAAFHLAGNWGSMLPGKMQMNESLRSDLTGDGVVDLVVHPAGALEVRQKIAPLNMRLEMYGNAPITGHNKITITQFQAGHLGAGNEFVPTSDSPEPTLVGDWITEHFARGQFEELSNQQKLSVPSFEKMIGGAVMAQSDAVRVDGEIESKPLGFESILLTEERLSTKRLALNGEDFDADGRWLLAGAARAKHGARKGGVGRFGTGQAPALAVQEEAYTLVNKDTLTRIDADVGEMTRMEADQTLADRVAQDPSLAGSVMVVPTYEEEAA